MGFNLTNEKIKDTYEQLLQVSGSTIVDGTGSVAPVTITSASHAGFAISASYAENAGDFDTSSLVTNTTFTAYTSSTATSTSASVADLQTQINALEAGSGSADWDLITNKPAGLVSSSAQIADDISGSFTSTSASIASDIQTNKSNISTNTTDISTLTGETSSYAVKTSNNTFTGTQTFDNISVNGTGSFAYIESVTGSAKIIGDAYIVLNNNTPTERYAGVKVFDSGSTNNSASFEFDGQTNDWFYEYTDDGGATEEFGVVMFGPGYNTRGAHVYPANNKILKGTGDHHIVDSSITDTGTSVSMSAPLTASGFQGDLDGTATSASYAVSASHLIGGGTAGLVSGTGTDSIRSSDDLTTTPAVAGGNYSVVIGEQASDGSNNEVVAIGFNNEASQRRSVGIGLDNSMNGDSSIAIGNSNTAQGPDAIVIGKGAQANTDGIAMGDGTQAGQNAVALGNGPSAGGQGAIVIGNQSAADFQGAIAIGDNTFAQATDAISIGRNVSAPTTASSINIGDIFKYDGTSIVTIENDLIRIADDGAQTGSLVDNMHPTIASSSAQIQHIVTIDQSAYLNISASGNVFDDTLYIISDATSTGIYDGNLNITGNLEVDGQLYSPTFAGTIASSTSSIDFNNGNFATLNCASSTFLANPSNLESGTTYTIIITNGANISGYGTAYKFAGGTEPTLSANTDVLTMVSDGTSLYATALADFS